jgi:hypothetical protein
MNSPCIYSRENTHKLSGERIALKYTNDGIRVYQYPGAIGYLVSEFYDHSFRMFVTVLDESSPHKPAPVPDSASTETRRRDGITEDTGTNAAYGLPCFVMIVEKPLCANSSNSGSFARAASEPKIFVLILCSPYGLYGSAKLVKYAK